MPLEIFKFGLLARTAGRIESVVCFKFLDPYFEKLPHMKRKNRRVLNGPYEDEIAKRQHINLFRKSGSSQTKPKLRSKCGKNLFCFIG